MLLTGSLACVHSVLFICLPVQCNDFLLAGLLGISQPTCILHGVGGKDVKVCRLHTQHIQVGRYAHILGQLPAGIQQLNALVKDWCCLASAA